MFEFILRAVDLALQVTIGFMIARIIVEILTGPRETFFHDLLRKPTEPFFRLVRKVIPNATYLVAGLGGLLILFLARVALNQVFLNLVVFPGL
jgi:uncharacterized protein YggT (Ycf19 family)